MFKKMMLFWLFLTVFTGCLFANGVNYQGEDPKLRLMAVEFLEENGFKKEVNSVNFQIEIKPDNEYTIPYEGYKAYLIRFKGDVDEWDYRRVLIKGDDIFNSYTDFNKMLKNEGIKIDSTNAFEIISNYLHLIKGKKLQIEKMNWINSEYKFVPGFAERAGINEKYFLNVEIYAYHRINGLKLKYLIGFKNGYIRITQTEILDFYKGDYIKDEKIPSPEKKIFSPNILEIGQSRERGSMEVNNYLYQTITFNKDYNPHYDGSPIPDTLRTFLKEENVIIKSDDSGTPTLLRTVDINFNGYTVYANTTQQIIMAIWKSSVFQRDT
ncbi:MAG: hypothetical protein P9M11_06950 [Candidatus Tenebribacter burtonii]|jgi:hypothetical protein|nr:hypothetical protein [Candidatus Tenebribacter burtonii]